MLPSSLIEKGACVAADASAVVVAAIDDACSVARLVVIVLSAVVDNELNMLAVVPRVAFVANSLELDGIVCSLELVALDVAKSLWPSSVGQSGIVVCSSRVVVGDVMYQLA